LAIQASRSLSRDFAIPMAQIKKSLFASFSSEKEALSYLR
jgi:hypothetical protein